MKRIPYIVYIAILLWFPQAGEAQDDEEAIITNQVWLDYYTYYYFKPKWEFYGDIGYRSIPEDFSWQTFHIRPSIRYIALSLYEVHGGVGFFQTFNKDEPNSFELRPWQGFRLKWPSFDPLFITHYVRLEERFFFPEDAPMEFNLRFRYRLAAKLYAFRLENKNYIYIPAYAEVFVDFGQQIHEVFSNRTRYSLGIGYRTNKEWSFEFHFVGQNSRSGDDQEFQSADRLYQFKVRRHLFKKEYKTQQSPDDI